MIIDKSIDEKMSLICLQIIREVVASGQHLYIMDNILLNCLLRIIQQFDSPLYGAAIDIVQSLMEITSQNVA